MSHPNPLKLLFIGNSHTYVNDLPALVRELAREDRCEAQVVMIAHGGWYLFEYSGLWCHGARNAQVALILRNGGSQSPDRWLSLGRCNQETAGRVRD